MLIPKTKEATFSNQTLKIGGFFQTACALSEAVKLKHDKNEWG